MNLTSKRIMFLILLIGLLVGPLKSELLAHGGEEHSHGSTTSSAGKEDLLKQLNSLYQEIADSVAQKQLSQIHDKTERIDELANALGAAVTGPEQAKVSGMLGNLKRASAALHKSADTADQAKCETNLKGLSAIVDLLNTKLSLPAK